MCFSKYYLNYTQYNNIKVQLKFIKQHRCVISDNVKILDDSIIPPEAIIPSFSVFGGKPGKLLKLRIIELEINC